MHGIHNQTNQLDKLWLILHRNGIHLKRDGISLLNIKVT